MKKIILAFLFAVSCMYAQNSFLVKYKSQIDNDNINNSINNITEKIKLLSKSNFTNLPSKKFVKPLNAYFFNNNDPIGKIFVVDFNNSDDNNTARNLFETDDNIEYTEINNLLKIDYVPNDSLINQQWALEKIGVFTAWETTTGSKDVLIAIIDTGIDYLHPDLSPNLFVNEKEDINHNGILDPADINNIDDDSNGFTDDVIGWDFTDRIGFPFSSSEGDYLDWDNNPNDEYGHGTWVAGVIGAVSNNRTGVSGIVPNALMLNVRTFDPTGFGEEDDAAAGILYAVQMGAKVINMSFGDKNFSKVLRDVVQYAYERGIVLVGSAGNTTSNLPHYPSGYPGVISCGATDYRDYLGSFSNIGSTLDLVAPGVNLLTTDRDNSYRQFSGTSASAPVVTSAAALLLSINSFTPEEISQILKSTSDDLGTTGWDESFGAGRININTAVTVKAPADIRIIYPKQDYATADDSINVTATILSGYFQKYELYFGEGLNPTEWNTLISDGQYQFSNKVIYTLKTGTLKDTVYCLRLIVYLQNGRTLEERANFYIDKTPPELQIVNLTDAFYGAAPTILGSIYTNEICTAFMHYRIKGETEFKIISLDGFSTNNLFFKQLHYGFIPLPIALPNNTYEMFFEAKNLTDKSSFLYNDGAYFEVTTDNTIYNTSVSEKNYQLPLGRIYDNTVDLLGNNSNEVLINDVSNSADLQIYKFNGISFEKIDSLKNRLIPKSVGDFNNNGKIDFLSYFYPKATIDEQTSLNGTKFSNKFVDSTAVFRPIIAQDIDGDLKTELLVFTNDTTLSIYEIDSDLKLKLETKLYNFSSISNVLNYKNAFGSPNAVITSGVAGTNSKELWVVDTEGDIISYNINGANTYSNGISINTSFYGVKNILSAGDYDGDGQNDLAVLLESSEDVNIAPFKLLLVLNIKNEQLNIIFQKIFIDPSIQFSSLGIKPKSSIKFANLIGSANDELVVMTYPYTYIFSNNNNINKSLFFAENSSILANEVYYNIFIDDLNSNGVLEFGIPVENNIKFYEITNSQAAVPVNLKGYSIDTSFVYLKWNSSGTKTYIFKGLNTDNLVLIDSTSSQFYNDYDVSNGSNYYYSLKSLDNSKTVSLSDFSSLIKVYVHPSIKIKSINSNDGESLVLDYTGKINTAILDLNSFIINNTLKPSSISINSETSYILNFNPFLANGSYVLYTNTLQDLYGSPIKNDTINFIVTNKPTYQEFYIESYEILNSKNIRISFNLPLNESTAFEKQNYYFSPYNQIKEISFVSESNNKSILVTVLNPVQSTGITQTVKLENIFSSIETGNIQINEGAGSYLVFSTFAASLSDMYVYPNPYTAESGNEIVYFANLTEKVNIIIFDINGNKINEISENDGNGGVPWNLTDMNGNKIPSGIYIYRAASVDNSNNEKEVKLGKFAVTR
ncbi:MAG: S8 family peptidase [bacterium]